MPKPSDEKRLFDLYARLDRLEEVIEDLHDLGVASIAEAEQAIIALNEEIDAIEGPDDSA
jgi:hypothetical protein